jgi:hypothetical protein
VLSARSIEHISRIRNLQMWHQGTVVIEDVHRLTPDLRMQVIDYLKFLADTEPIDRKLVLIGIPNSGSALVEESFDLATRIDVYELVSTQLVLSMIEKGENALHLEFDQKTEIAVAAGGSLNVAQSLCFRVCKTLRSWKLWINELLSSATSRGPQRRCSQIWPGNSANRSGSSQPWATRRNLYA